MSEAWRPVVGYEGVYEVSSEGSVRRVGAGRLMVGAVARKTGYRYVTLCAGGKQRTRLRHLLVAGAFLPPRPPGADANHKDTDKANNRADNLEWVTRWGNIDHARRAGLMPTGSKNGMAKLTETQVADIRRRYRPVKPGGPSNGGKPREGSQRALAAEYGVNQRVIWYVVNHVYWKLTVAK
jgi:hypothetical protein